MPPAGADNPDMRTFPDLVVEQARAVLLDSFGWIDGHADVWRVFRRPEALAAVIHGLAAPFAGRGVTAVIGVEARGFLLGAAVAVELESGFVAVRKTGALFPGATISRTTDTADYRGNRYELLPTDRILLVDDWIETGTQAQTVTSMVRQCARRSLASPSWLTSSIPRAKDDSPQSGHS